MTESNTKASAPSSTNTSNGGESKLPSNPPPTESALVKSVKSFISGGFGGISLVLVGHPFDLVKVKIQTSAEYSGTFQALRSIFANEGVAGLYKGMSTPLVGITPVFAVCFWGYDMGQNLSRTIWGQRLDDKTPLTLGQISFAGGFSAVPTTLLMTPMERIKVLMQTQGTGKDKLYNGPLDAAGKLYREGGIRSLYRGTVATLVRDVPGSVAYFAAYEVVKGWLTPAGSSPSDLNTLAVLFAGGMAGVANWVVAIPPDVLKSRLQSAPEGTYTGIVDVFNKLIKTEGPTALFRGLGPAVIRAFPANAACFLGVEVFKKVSTYIF